MQLFYNAEIKLENNLLLPEEEARHIVKVLRYKLNDKIFFTNGKGFLFEGMLINNNYKNCEIKWINKVEGNDARNTKLHLAIAPTKNIDRLEWLVEKVTELGVDEITPLLCNNSEKITLKTERLNKIAISAMKQSNRTFLPAINKLTTFIEFFNLNIKSNVYIAHCYNSEKTHLKKSLKLNSDAIVLIGPEGDFSEKEVELAISKKAMPISLGNIRLRTETAALKACCTVNLLHE